MVQAAAVRELEPVAQLAAAVYGRVLLSRDNLGDFGEFTLNWPCMPHHRTWTDELDDERVKRIIILAPPAGAKTTWVGIAYTARELGKDPAQHIAYLTYNDEVAQSRSTAIRDLTQSPEFQLVYPGTKPDKKKGWGEKEWYLQRPDSGDADPSLKAAGLFGAVLAYHFHQLVLDDPHDPEEVISETQRKKAWGRIQNVVLPRLFPDARMVVTGFRWAEDDIPGKLMEEHGYHMAEDCPLKRGEGDTCTEWHVVLTEALRTADDGTQTSYWPEQWPVKKLINIRREIGGSAFACQYQGKPAPEEGHIFQWWPTYNTLPTNIRGIDVPIDMAYTDTQRSDWTSWAAWAYDDKPKPMKYLLDAGRCKDEMPEAEKKVAMFVHRLRIQYPRLPVRIKARKKVAIDRVAGQHLAYLGIPVALVPMPGGSKADLARLIVGEFEAGRARVPENPGTQLDEWFHQHKMFDQGKFDDFVETTIIEMLSHQKRGARVSTRPMR